jgi:hypothetical protein
VGDVGVIWGYVKKVHKIMCDNIKWMEVFQVRVQYYDFVNIRLITRFCKKQRSFRSTGKTFNSMRKKNEIEKIYI